MKILGLFIVVLGGAATSKFLGCSDVAITLGAVIGGGTYVLINNN